MSFTGKIFVVADDLTGAADAAVAFAERGIETRIVFEPEHATTCAADAVAISIESRDVPEHKLASRNEILYTALQKGHLSFKKIDSMFRGNTFAEIATIASAELDDPILLAPAYPALGRKLVSGTVLWSDHLHNENFSVEEPLCERGVQCVRIAVDQIDQLADLLRSYKKGPPTVFLCDASEQQHLDRIVAAGLEAERPVLWMGSGGLALALAARQMPSSHPGRVFKASRGRVIFIVGSDHPVTLHQLQHLQERHPGTSIIVPVKQGITSADDIRSAISAIHRNQIGCVFMTGGDTAMFACRALQIESLIVESEFAQGVPMVSIAGGDFDGTLAILKSGGFGEVSLFCQIVERYHGAEEDAA